MIQRFGIALAFLLVAATVAQAGPPFACCLCADETGPILCSAIPSDGIDQFGTACSALGGMNTGCSATADPETCLAGFADAGCPAQVGAPVAGSGSVLALTALLGSLGVFALRSGRTRR
jgi:hypothetical protein